VLFPAADSLALLPNGRLALAGSGELPGITATDGTWQRFTDGEATRMLSVSPQGEVRYFGILTPLFLAGQHLESRTWSAGKGLAPGGKLTLPVHSVRAAYLDAAGHVMFLGTSQDESLWSPRDVVCSGSSPDRAVLAARRQGS